MVFFSGKHLRVLTPRTIDGTTPDLSTGNLVYKEDLLPMSAKRDLELQNKNLPDILKKKIQVVGETDVQQGATTKNKKL